MSEDRQTVKQAIVMRYDLKMGRGKQIAQAALASMWFMGHRFREYGPASRCIFSEVERAWLAGTLAKSCYRVGSEEELISIYDKSIESVLTAHLITDSGTNDLPGVPTRTCLSIGPDEAKKIDRVTGHLPLL